MWDRPSTRTGHSLLVVDDNDGTRASIAKVLQRGGYEVEATGDPWQALAALTRDGRTFDAVIVDVVMPRMNGVAFCQRLDEAGIQAPVIYISGLVEEDALRDWGVARDSNFIQKPFEVGELLAAVRAAVRSAERRTA